MRRQLLSASTHPSAETPPSDTHTHTPAHFPLLSIISIWCEQPVCVVLISSNKSVIIAVLSPLPPPPLLLTLLPSPAAVFPFVQRASVLRGAHALLRRRDRLCARLPALSQDCVSGPQGKQEERRERGGEGGWVVGGHRLERSDFGRKLFCTYNARAHTYKVSLPQFCSSDVP